MYEHNITITPILLFTKQGVNTLPCVIFNVDKVTLNF